MLFKAVMFALSTFVLNRKLHPVSRKASMLAKIRRTARREANGFGLRMLTGLILSCAIVYSLIQIGNTAHDLLAQVENGLVIELIGYVVLASIASGVLYFLFQRPAKNRAELSLQNSSLDGRTAVEEAPEIVEPFHIKELGTSFIDGFLDGFKSRRQSEPANVKLVKTVNY